MADFFKKLSSQGSAGPQFLSDHPNPGNREEAIQKEIASWPAQKYNAGDGSFAAARQHAMSVKVYSAQEIAQRAKTGQCSKLNQQNGATFKAPVLANEKDSNPNQHEQVIPSLT